MSNVIRTLLLRAHAALRERGPLRLLDLLVRRVFDWRYTLARLQSRPTRRQRSARRHALQTLPQQPRITVLQLVDAASVQHLSRRLQALQRQDMVQFSVIFVVDPQLSHSSHLLVERSVRNDRRYSRAVWQPGEMLASALQRAVTQCTTPYIMLLDLTVEPAVSALGDVAVALQARPQTTLLYGDDDAFGPLGCAERPRRRPAWDRYQLRERDYVDFPVVMRRELLRELLPLLDGDRHAQLLDLLLRADERLAPEAIERLPLRLARIERPHRAPARSAAAVAAVGAHLARCRIDAVLVPVAHRPDLSAVIYALPPELPLVSVLIPTRDRLDLLRPCVETLLQVTDYAALEVLIIDNDSQEPATLAFLSAIAEHPQVRVLRDDGEFNYAALNNRAAAVAAGELLCLLNNDTEIVDAAWLTALVSLAVQPGIATVGPLLLYPDGNIQCMGVTTGPVYPATTIGTGPATYQRRHNQLWVTRAVIANTAACLVLRRELFLSCGGFDEQLKVDFNDVELGLRLHQMGYVNLWTPHVRVMHRHGATRGRGEEPAVLARRMREAAYMTKRYPTLIGNDPFYRTSGPQTHRPADASTDRQQP